MKSILLKIKTLMNIYGTLGDSSNEGYKEMKALLDKYNVFV